MRRFVHILFKMSRRSKTILKGGADFFLVAGSFITSLNIKFDTFDTELLFYYWHAMLICTISSLLTFYFLGLYKSITRFASFQILKSISVGSATAAILMCIITYYDQNPLPVSVSIIFFMLCVFSVGGLRFSAQAIFLNPFNHKKRPTIIYGAGEAGRQLIQILSHGREFLPVAIIDDDPNLQGLTISGLQVHNHKSISKIIAEQNVDVIMLAVPSTHKSNRKRILGILKQFKIEIKTVPDISEILSGKATIAEIRNISSTDLLGRNPVTVDSNFIEKEIKNNVVMVTGAGGSIGSELCRQIIGEWPSVVILLDSSELALYQIHTELSEQIARYEIPTKVIPLLGSVQNSLQLEGIIKSYGVHTIYHAAAYKHVPLLEENIIEGIQNNVFGTLTLVSVATKLKVQKFILISTDKAVRPTNIMGASKRTAELICQAYSRENVTTVFSMVRFGNVLESSGSVFPRFREQIAKGGPVTVTHREITRYFMTIPEAAQLVIHAGAMAKNGDLFLLDMGEPKKILDLAIEMIELHGFEHYIVENTDEINNSEIGKIPICFTGLRKGEKLYEELLLGNNPKTTKHPRIMVASEVFLPLQDLSPLLSDLLKSCKDMNLDSIVKKLKNLPIEYCPSVEKNI